MSRRERVEVALATLLGLGLFLAFAGRGRLPLDNDALYAHVIRCMRVGGDWLQPNVLGVPFLDKPPLFYWLGAAFTALLGESELTLRLSAALFGALTVGALVLAARRSSAHGGAAPLAVAALLSVPLFVEYSRRVYMEVPVAFCVLGALLAYQHASEGLDGRGGRPGYHLWAGLLVGLGVMLKSLVGLFGVLPVLVLLVLRRRWRDLRSGWLWAGGVLAAVVAVPWHAWQLVTARSVFLDFTWRLHVEDQILQAQPWSAGPPWFYLEKLCTDEPTLGAIILVGVGLSAYQLVRGRLDGLNRLLVLAVLIMLAVFSFSATKKVLYLVPVAPPAVLLLARLVAGLASTPRLTLLAAGCAALLAFRALPLFDPEGEFLRGAEADVQAARAAARVTETGGTINLLDHYFSAFQYYADRRTVSYWRDPRVVQQTRRIPYIRHGDNMRAVGAQDARAVGRDELLHLLLERQPGVWVVSRGGAGLLNGELRPRVIHQDQRWLVLDTRRGAPSAPRPPEP